MSEDLFGIWLSFYICMYSILLLAILLLYYLINKVMLIIFCLKILKQVFPKGICAASDNPLVD